MQYHGRNPAVTGSQPLNGLEKPHAPRLLDQVRDVCRWRHCRLRTARAYVGWIRCFILANGKRHPRDLGAEEVSAFLTTLAATVRGGQGVLSPLDRT
ncbi:MAG: phage integrase N-terminal SAM-like domain-containing protein [Gammaproteobacteria bacterium]|nr:phage integrase N-terminal SAM-like domain-containing protein [Gammaproteobacteria bacterium]